MDIYSMIAASSTVLSFLAFLGIVRVGVQQAAQRRASTRRRTRRSRCPTTRDGVRGSAIVRSGGHERLHIGLLELVRHRR